MTNVIHESRKYTPKSAPGPITLFGGPRTADGAGRREDPGALGIPPGAW